MNDQEKLATEEAERLKRLLFDFNVSDTTIELLEATIENAAWMKIKLDETRETIKKSKVVIPYNNGGGQKGLRENPLFRGYEGLLKSYMAALKVIMDCLPSRAENIKNQELEKPQTMLELVRNKHKRKEA